MINHKKIEKLFSEFEKSKKEGKSGRENISEKTYQDILLRRDYEIKRLKQENELLMRTSLSISSRLEEMKQYIKKLEEQMESQRKHKHNLNKSKR